MGTALQFPLNPLNMNEPKSMARNLGGRIKQFRASVDLSQRDFAKMCKVSQANVSQWESGKISPPTRLIQLIKSHYPKVRIEWFFDENPVSDDPFHSEARAKLDKQTLQLSTLKKEIEQLKELTDNQEKEIRRLRDQNEVLAIVAKKRLLK